MKRLHPTILLIDDDPDDLAILQSTFLGLDSPLKLQTAGGGEEALAYLKGDGKYSDRTVYGYPDFVISDLKMPGIDGFTVLEYLKKHPDYSIIPTVILSGSVDRDDIRKAYMLGASSYHVKPTSLTPLRVLVRAIHDYWMLCEAPEVGSDGRIQATHGTHKLSERFGQSLSK
jgi:CheY-like chemotaxis protein